MRVPDLSAKSVWDGRPGLVAERPLRFLSPLSLQPPMRKLIKVTRATMYPCSHPCLRCSYCPLQLRSCWPFTLGRTLPDRRNFASELRHCEQVGKRQSTSCQLSERRPQTL